MMCPSSPSELKVRSSCRSCLRRGRPRGREAGAGGRDCSSPEGCRPGSGRRGAHAPSCQTHPRRRPCHAGCTVISWADSSDRFVLEPSMLNSRIQESLNPRGRLSHGVLDASFELSSATRVSSRMGCNLMPLRDETREECRPRCATAAVSAQVGWCAPLRSRRRPPAGP